MMSLCLIYLALFVVRSHGGSVSELQEPPQPKQATNTDVSISVVVENIKVWSMVNNRAKRSTQLSVESRNTFPKNQITDQHPGNPGNIMDLISLISLLLLLPVWCLVFWTLDVYQTYERDDLTLGWKLLLILFSILNIPMFVYLVFEIRTKKNQKRVSPKSCFGKDWNCWFIFCVFLPLLLGIIMFRMWYSKIFKPYNLREPKHRVLLSIYIVLGFPMLVYYLVDYCTYVKKNNGSTTRPSFPNPTTTTMGKTSTKPDAGFNEVTVIPNAPSVRNVYKGEAEVDVGPIYDQPPGKSDQSVRNIHKVEVNVDPIYDQPPDQSFRNIHKGEAEVVDPIYDQPPGKSDAYVQKDQMPNTSGTPTIIYDEPYECPIVPGNNGNMIVTSQSILYEQSPVNQNYKETEYENTRREKRSDFPPLPNLPPPLPIDEPMYMETQN
uniref:uncharacterized protein LOC104266755 isoform X5 n=1 Tax=Ciona intestinalis TaxID=7719 RepID=UPI000EF51DAE|nr:uncharacterized protein LOC104266755 isoform X5 [Ciona intestinalis]|eukprot:XP_026696096.1 uncharacterized protein LOC104266755 isoform X5 [Ciona intestinalis]